MVSIVYLTLSALLGLLAYILIPFVGGATSASIRHRVAQYYWGKATRAWGKICLLKRTVGGYKWKRFKLDDEKGAAKVVLDDGVLGDKKELYFDDPDNRLKRLNKKPLAIIHEEVPGVVDPSLAELGSEWREHYSDGKHERDDAINPYFEVDGGTSLVNIDDVLPLVLHGTQPSDLGKMEDYTRKRFEKYRSSVGAGEVLSTLTGFAVGLGGMAAIGYVRSNLLDGGAGGEPTNPVPVQLSDVALTALDYTSELVGVIA